MKKGLPFLLLLVFVYSGFCQDKSTSSSPKISVARSNYPRNAHHVVGGGDFAVEIRNGELWAWGSNQYGQLGIGNNLLQQLPVREATFATNWSDFNPGQSHVLAVKADGTLWAWGRNHRGQLGLGDTLSRNTPQQIGFDNDWVTTGCGGNQSFAIKSNGTLWAWGENSSGQLGIGNNQNTSANWAPIQVGLATNWISVAAGNNFTVGLNASGGMFTWGSDAFGQLGNGAASASFSPAQIQQSSRWTVVEAGADYAMAIMSDGNLYAWGRNNRGQLGDNTTTNRVNPVLIASTTPWIGVSCGQAGPLSGVQHTVGLKANGTVWTWGDNTLGALGNSQVSSPTVNVPTAVFPTVSNIAAVETGNGLTYIRNTSGQVYAAGTDINGAFGNDSTTQSNVFLPISVVPVSWSSVAAGQNFNIALKSDGTIWMWGSNANGLLGNGTSSPSNVLTATQIGTASNWKAVSAGANHAFAINASGDLFAWGDNTQGQIGNGLGGGTAGGIVSPVLISSAIPWICVSAGNTFSLGIKADGSLWSWGLNTSGQLGQGNNNSGSVNFSPVRIGSANDWVFAHAGRNAAIAAKADGTIWMWGDNAFGQLGRGNNSSGSQNFSPVAVAGTDYICAALGSSSSHVIALKSNGTLWSWGRNNEGQLGNGTNLVSTSNYSPVQIGTQQTWVSVSAGYEHSAALRSDGTPWTWGDNTQGQLGLNYFGNSPAAYSPTQVSNLGGLASDQVISISCGWYHTAIIKETRERICVTGQNTSGQIGDGTLGSANNRNEFQCMVYGYPCVQPDIPSLSRNPSGTICAGTNVTLNIVSGNLNSAAQWRWYADSCSGTPIGTGASIVVSPSVTKTYFVRGESGGCVSPGACAQITVTVNSASAPTAISGPAGACRNQTGVVFSVTPVSGATTYNWTLPTGATGSSTTNSISVNFGSTFVTGNICVSVTSSCGTTPVFCRSVAYYSTAPSTPGTMSGPSTNVCAGFVHTYSIAALSNALNYTWAVPAGCTLVSGQGTTSIQMTVPTGFVSGNVTVNASNCVGTSTNRTLTVRGIPAMPGTPTGTTVGACPGTNRTYTITSVLGASSYTWSTPTAMPIVSGQGTTSITVTIPPGFVTGNISVKANSACGSSALRNLSIRSVPTQPGTISGPINNLCGGGTATYSIAAVTGATSYNWVVPTSWVITANTGTSITVSLPISGFSSGTVSVAAVNACGAGTVRTLSVSALPAQPAVISGPSTVCVNQTAVNFSTTAVSGLSYSWIFPSGVSIVSGQGTASVIVNWGTTAGTVSVKAQNACGFSTARTKSVTIGTCRVAQEPNPFETELDEEVVNSMEQLSAFPNPVNDMLHVLLPVSEAQSCRLMITDISGKVVFEQTISGTGRNNKVSVSSSSWSAGMYFISVLSSEGSLQTLKVLKN
jgi:alpha-tubulin suppressor-like RCC1 family protein